MNRLIEQHLKMTIGCVMGVAICTGFWAAMFMPGQRKPLDRTVKVK